MRSILILTLVSFLIFGCKEEIVKSTNASGIFLPSETAPAIDFNIWLNVGSQNDPIGKEGVAFITAELMSDGSTLNNSYSDILDKLYPIASGYSVKVDKEMTSFRASTHPDNIEEFYPMLIDALLRPAFNEEDFNRIKQNTIQSIEKSLRFSSDEELAKAALMQEIYKGSRYSHLTMGTVQSLNNLTIQDVKDFYENNIKGNFNIGLAGSYNESLVDRLYKDLVGDIKYIKNTKQVEINPKAIDGLNVYLIEKNAISTPICFGFPIDVTRANDDYFALDLFRSWFGEHRNQSSHLYQVIREARGINYGDYAYIEAFLNGGSLSMPNPNNPRNEQIFQVWIRSVPHQVRHFSLRAAIRELQMVVDNGMTQEAFESTKQFLYKYSLHYAPTLSTRLGYQIDADFYGIKGGYIDIYREKIKNLTLEQVNAAIKKYIQYDNMMIAAVTKDAEGFRTELIENGESSIKDWYSSEKPEEIYEEDKTIANYPLDIKEDKVTIVPVSEMFEK
ncbi:pitrilysin family protein [Candidatus Kapabacteria bacterium]|nr:pitrilysin family protein [Candidatus Kapabacteria bacterium]